MKESKFDRFMGKVMVFCWKHRFAIGLGTSMLGAYCYGAHKQSEVYKAQEAAIQKEKELQERIRKLDEETKARYEDPANQLSSGGVVLHDAWDEGDGMANLIIGRVPMSKMGEFGESVIDRIATHPGSMAPEDLSDILLNNPHCDILLSIYPGNTEEPEEPESQEKQGC